MYGKSIGAGTPKAEMIPEDMVIDNYRKPPKIGWTVRDNNMRAICPPWGGLVTYQTLMKVTSVVVHRGFRINGEKKHGRAY